MNKSKFDNHGLPEHYECYTCIVTKRGDRLYMQFALNPVPRTFEPYPEHGIDIFTRADWTDAIKVCYQNFLPSPELRGSILRHIRKTYYPTATFYKHIEPTST